MAAPTPVEERLLEPAAGFLSSRLRNARHEARLDVLEAASSLLGPFDPHEYRAIREDDDHELSVPDAVNLALELLAVLSEIKIHPAFALSSLSRPPLTPSNRRTSGAYYTDFRLAEYLAKDARHALVKGTQVLDPASGTGILLVAATLVATESEEVEAADYLRHWIHAADLDPLALRGTALSLSAMTSDLGAIAQLMPRLRTMDSLLTFRGGWEDLAPDGFGLVIGNPPWEKLKVSRHEHLLANGVRRHYGARYERGQSLDGHERSQAELRDYSEKLLQLYTNQGSGEPDLYKLFMELAIGLAHRDHGQIAFLVPAGLIRSKGTEGLRRLLLSRSASFQLTVLENRARFFAIDSRFKFLGLNTHLSDGPSRVEAVELIHADSTEDRIEERSHARIEVASLAKLRPDLTVPEVRSTKEWALFRRLAEVGPSFGDPDGQWKPVFSREVDMTRDRDEFQPPGTEGCAPLIEGRMVHQYRHAAKRFVSGSGRAAIWEPLQLGDYSIEPQFTYPIERLRGAAADRLTQARVGFCDVTGQTNERSMLAAHVPPGVVCGNKVPTIRFEKDPAEVDDWLHLWTGIANSFVFDWSLRRIITTSVNYFLLRSVAIPEVSIHDPRVAALIKRSRWLNSLESGSVDFDLWEVAEVRAEIDADVAHLYGLEYDDMVLVMDDFPLLDNHLKPLPGEQTATLTRDLVLLFAARVLSGADHISKERLEWRVTQAGSRSAPYVPSSFGRSARRPRRRYGP